MGLRGTPLSMFQGHFLLSTFMQILIGAAQGRGIVGITLQGFQGVLQSKGFPKGYPKEEIIWKIQGYHGTATKYTFVFIWLDLRPGFSSTSCDKDYVSILENYQGTLQETQRYCGKRGFFVSLAHGSRVGVKFKSIGNSDRKGFRLIWRAKRDKSRWKRSRNFINSKTSGLLQSPGFPYYQPFKTDYKWRLKLPNGFYKIVLRFIWFDVGSNPKPGKCTSGVLKISQEFNGQLEVKHRLCGYKKSFSTLEYGDTFEFHFRSKKLIKRAGFRMVWYAVRGCYGESENRDYGSFSTLSFQKPFSIRGLCQWRIKVPNGFNGIEIIFSSQQRNTIRDSRKCGDQALIIQDRKKETIKSICNGHYPYLLNLPGREFTILFKSGKSAIDSAFSLHWSAVEETSGCGKPVLHGKVHQKKEIIGGDVENEAWPWIVQIRTILNQGGFKKMIIRCSGALIKENWIITAAHCVDFPSKTSKVQIEGFDASMTAEELHIHPLYQGGIQNDIALIRYENVRKPRKKVNPICLPAYHRGDFNETSHCFLSGRGRRESNRLPEQRHTTSVVYYGVCSSSATIICAGDPNKISGACDGDSGGPLMCSGADGRYYLAGVLSHGPKQCGSDLDVYINPKYYLGWLQEMMTNSNAVKFAR